MPAAKTPSSTKPRRGAKAGGPTAEEVARAYFEALAARDEEAAADRRAPDVIADIVPAGIVRGADEYREFVRALLAAFPDYELTVEDVIGGEGVAAVKWRWSGTFSGGPFQGLEPTGRRVEVRTVDWVEVEDGKVKKVTAYFDGLEFARAVGMMPPKDSPAERAMLGAFNGVTRLRSAVRERMG